MDGTKGSDYLDCLDPKAADTDPQHQRTQVYPRYLWELVPFGLDSWMPPKMTAKNAA